MILQVLKKRREYLSKSINDSVSESSAPSPFKQWLSKTNIAIPDDTETESLEHKENLAPEVDLDNLSTNTKRL